MQGCALGFCRCWMLSCFFDLGHSCLCEVEQGDRKTSDQVAVISAGSQAAWRPGRRARTLVRSPKHIVRIF